MMTNKMQVLNLKNTLEDLTESINDFLSPYTKEPVFWVLLAIALLLIACWGIRHFGGK